MTIYQAFYTAYRLVSTFIYRVAVIRCWKAKLDSNAPRLLAKVLSLPLIVVLFGNTEMMLIGVISQIQGWPDVLGLRLAARRQERVVQYWVLEAAGGVERSPLVDSTSQFPSHPLCSRRMREETPVGQT